MALGHVVLPNVALRSAVRTLLIVALGRVVRAFLIVALGHVVLLNVALRCAVRAFLIMAPRQVMLPILAQDHIM